MDYLGQERMGSAEFFYFGVQHSLALQTLAEFVFSQFVVVAQFHFEWVVA